MEFWIWSAWGGRHYFRTDSQGEYVIYAQSGEYLLTVNHPFDDSVEKLLPFSVTADMDIVVQFDPFD